MSSLRDTHKDHLNSFVQGDALEVMQGLPSNSIPLILFSPPYNLRKTTGAKGAKSGKWAGGAVVEVGYDGHDDEMPQERYVEWQREILTQCMRLIPNDGAVFFNHQFRVQGGLLQDHREILDGFPVRQQIIWQRYGGHNFNAGYFVPTYQVVYMIAKPAFKLTKGANRHGDVWKIPVERKADWGINHPAPMPVALAERIISSTDARLVLDPFMGSGTTAIAARRLGRYFIGIDRAKAYCRMAEDRLRREYNTPAWRKFFATKRSTN